MRKSSLRPRGEQGQQVTTPCITTTNEISNPANVTSVIISSHLRVHLIVTSTHCPAIYAYHNNKIEVKKTTYLHMYLKVLISVLHSSKLFLTIFQNVLLRPFVLYRACNFGRFFGEILARDWNTQRVFDRVFVHGPLRREDLAALVIVDGPDQFCWM